MATPPRYLRWRHRQAAVLTALGWKTCEIAAQFRVSPCTVRHWRTAPAFCAEVAKAAAEIRQTVITLTAQERVGAEPMRRQKPDVRQAPAFVRGPSGGRQLIQ